MAEEEKKCKNCRFFNGKVCSVDGTEKNPAWSCSNFSSVH
ncbi:hypothetical protein RsTz2092_10570 [Deferribacterales bacterium RsTz2092]